MSEQLVLRPRRPKRRRTLRFALTSAPAAALVAAGAGGGPQIGFHDPESHRGAIVSASITAFLHGGIIAVLAFFAWIAPDVAEDTVIEVTVLKELPGSKAPAPKSLAPRRPVSAASIAQVRARAPLPPDAPNPLSPESFQRAQVVRAQVQNFERVQLQAERLTVQQTELAPASTLDVATLSPVAVSATDLRAPSFRYEGPRAIDTRARIDSLAPEAFQAPKPMIQDYQGAANYTAPKAVFTEPGAARYGADIQIAGRWLSGGDGEGGTGTELGVVSCGESAFVSRYYDEMERRTQSRWQVPPNTASNETVVLRFQLDRSGSITTVKFVQAASPALGESAVQALRAASPFPPLDDNVRECLTGPLRAIFDVPSP